jgi:hypothetical protein
LNLVDNCDVRGNVGSDHFPVYIQLSLTAPKKQQATKESTDWSSFHRTISESKRPLPSADVKVDDEINAITMLMRNALSMSTTTTNICMRKGYPLSKETSSWLDTRKTLMKANLTVEERALVTCLYNRANRKVQALLKLEDQHNWEKVESAAASAPDVTTKWKAVKKLMGSFTPPASPLEDAQGNLVVAPQDIENVHADHLKKTHTPVNHPAFDEDWCVETEAWVRDHQQLLCPLPGPANEIMDDEMPPITTKEIKGVGGSQNLSLQIPTSN